MTYKSALTALADPTRRQIFETLSAAPQSVGAIAKVVPISRPAVSQHLKVLSEADLVAMTKRGTQNIYSANPYGLDELRRYLDQFWGDVLENFAAEVKRQEGKT